LSSKKKKKQRIRVFAPFKPVIHPEEEEIRTQEKRLEEERLKVLEFSRKTRKGFGVFSMAVGAFIFGFFAYFVWTGMTLKAVTTEIKIALLALAVLLGAINIITGLLLIGEY
jgi:hypothetical protein